MDYAWGAVLQLQLGRPYWMSVVTGPHRKPPTW
jgi:hypothetical protein